VEATLEQAQALLEQFGLTGSDAKTLVALIRLGTGTVNQLAPLTGIVATNIYRHLESLQKQQLVDKSSGRNAVWSVVGREELLARLRQREAEKFRGTEEALEQFRTVLEEVPEAEETARAVIQVTDEVSAGIRYCEAVASASTEILSFNRGPYAGEMKLDPNIVASLARGVRARAVWQADEVYGSGSKQALECAIAYAEAGVETRVVDQLPLSLALIDRSMVFLRLPGDEPSDLPYVATAAVENRSLAEFMVPRFEQLWDEGQALEAPPPQKHQSSHAGRRTHSRGTTDAAHTTIEGASP